MKLRLAMFTIILPLLGLAGFFALLHLKTERDLRDHAYISSKKIHEENHISNLVHQLQRERGYTAGYLASHGKNFSEELTKQHTETDGFVQPVLTQTDDLRNDHPESYGKMLALLPELAPMRTRVLNTDVEAASAVAFYTGLIETLLSASHHLETSDARGQMQTMLEIRTLIGAAKEKAGLERATGATGLGSTFTLPLHNRFVLLGGAQQALLQEASILLHELNMENSIYTSESYQNIEAARRIIEAGLTSSDYKSLSPSEWFKISTAWIDDLRTIEIGIGEIVTAMSDNTYVIADNNFQKFLWICVAGMALTALVALTIFERLIIRIKLLTRVVDGFAKGDFNVFVPGIHRKDELSMMAKAIYHFKQETLAMRRAAEDLKASDEAALNAKHGRVVELVTEGLAALAKADLTSRFDDPLDGEYDEIRCDFNTASERLRTVLASIAETVTDLDQASAAMKASALDLASRTNEQVDTIRDTTERVDALSLEVESFGNDIISAASLAGSAREQANTSADVMREAVDAMSRIQNSSEQIGQIISMIEDISFQTNLLALNAGVEAARAGEAGRGFAVVASEVRALAQRASTAAMQIKQLVNESGTHVAAGVQLVGRTGAALGEISTGITQIDDVLSRVSEASEEQIKSLQDLASSMKVINNLAGQNTSMAMDTQTASGDIAIRSSHLADLIRDFKLRKDNNVSAVEQAA